MTISPPLAEKRTDLQEIASYDSYRIMLYKSPRENKPKWVVYPRNFDLFR